MTHFVFFLKFSMGLGLLGGLLLKILKHRSEKSLLIFVLMFFVMLLDIKLILDDNLPTEWAAQMALLLIYLYLTREFFYVQGTKMSFIGRFLDFKELLNADLYKFLEVAIVVLKKDNLEVVASNQPFKKNFTSSNQIVSIPEVVSKIQRGNHQLELVDFNNMRKIFKVRMHSLGIKYSVLYFEDISELEDISQQLMEEERYFKALWDNGPNMVMIRTLSGEIVYLNALMEIFTQQTIESLYGKPFTKIYPHSADAETHEKAQRPLIDETKKSLKQIFKRTTGDGRMQYFEAHESIIHFHNEKHIITNGVDLTVKIHTDFLLQTYEALQKTADNYPLMVVDFLDNELLYADRINKLLTEPVYSYKTFLSRLSDYDQKKLTQTCAFAEDFEPFSVMYENRDPFIVERLFKQEQGFTTGLLIKYVNPNSYTYSFEHIGGLILNHIKEGVLIINFDGDIEYANDMVLRLLNYTSKDLLSKKIVDIAKGLTMEMVRKNWILSKEHESLQFDRVYYTKDGEEISAEVVSLIMGNVDSEKLLLLVKPVDETVLTKKTFFSVNLRYAHIFNALDHQLIQMKLPQKTLSFYDRFDEEEGLIGLELNFLQWLNSVHDHDRSTVYESVDTIIMNQLEQMSFEYRYFSKGEWHWIRSIAKYTEGTEGPSIIIVNQNITELKGVADKLDESKRIMLESERIAKMSHWKYEVNKNHFIISNTFKELFDIHLLSDTIHYEQLLEQIQWTDRAYFEDKFSRFIWNGDYFDIIVRTPQREGVQFVHFLGKIYFDDDKVPIYAIGTIANITKAVKSRQQLEASKLISEHILDQIPNGLIIIKRNGDIDRINQKALHLFKITDFNMRDYDQLSKHIDRYFDLEDHATLDAFIEKTNKEAHTMNLKDKKSPETSGLRVTITPLFDEENRFYGNIISIEEAAS